MKDFNKCDILPLGMEIVDMVYDLYDGLPWQQVAEYKAQSMRAGISIPSNIAEDNSRRTEREKFRYMEIALGSAFELETQTLSAQRRAWCPKDKVELLIQALEREQKMLSGFMSVLKP